MDYKSDSPVYQESYYRATSALPTIRFPPASVTEELAQFPKRARVRWEDIKPTVTVAFVALFLYIGMHATDIRLIAFGWGCAAGVLAFGLMPKRRRPVYTRLYAWRVFGQTFLVRGEEDDEWFAKGKR